ncbi:MAG: exo-alpha-sialidase [Acidimicrobiia bacterium]|nr:exo-alpha-sialidase [Acidimicrobiia bacterium]
MNRRFFFASLLPPAFSPGASALVNRLERFTIWERRQSAPCWFHPRACLLPDGSLFMTLQTISGSDFFGPVHWSLSRDGGMRWSDPQPVPGLGRRPLEDGLEEAVSDVVPQYHARSRTLLAIGHNLYYKDGKLTMPAERRWPVYCVRRGDDSWDPPRRLEWGNPDADGIYTSGCAQRIHLDNGGILLPLSFGSKRREDRAVATALCSFDGSRLAFKRHGPALRLPVKRGLLEPALARFRHRFYMTIRAEDGRGYLTHSRDGLHWSPIQPWCFHDGEELVMSTTQQRWLAHSDGLFLVYTRKRAENLNVTRWRAPLLMAQLDTESLTLRRDTEMVVFPMLGDGIARPQEVALMGNFHTSPATPAFSLITVGENLASNGFRGNTLAARVYWNRPNRLAGRA